MLIQICARFIDNGFIFQGTNKANYSFLYFGHTVANKNEFQSILI
jgi:hypothetical protein